MSANNRGIFIVFEGCDRSGKSTQSSALFELLKRNGVDVKAFNYPDRGTSSGEVLNSYLLNAREVSAEAVHLMFTANRWESKENLVKTLLRGTTIICDRYAYSGVAYSVAKGLDFDWCYAAERGLLQPDAVFYMKANPEQLVARAGYGEERFEKVEFQRKVSEIFDRFNAQESSYWHAFDAKRPQKELQTEIANKVDRLLNKVAKEPLRWLS